MMISVVIPTRNRPGLLVRAVRSALAQTHPTLEVIVVIDGPDSESIAALTEVRDHRLLWNELPESRGANRARNAGAAMASGEWVAFLDDDDEWFPEKLERQFTLLAEANFDPSLVISCRFLMRTPEGDAIWPRRLPDEGESIGDYMFNRRTLFNGEAAMNTSTLLIPRKMVNDVQFSAAVKKHQEIDFLLRASDHPLVRVEFVPDPLAIWNVDVARKAITNSRDWVRSFEWIRSHRARLSRGAYSGFLLISLASEAAGQRDWSAFFPILRDAIVFGRPTLCQLLRYCSMWFVPQKLRHRIRFAIRERRPVPQTGEIQNVPS
jgi:glycosyltransferase involved in cell wall biosynthesis